MIAKGWRARHGETLHQLHRKIAKARRVGIRQRVFGRFCWEPSIRRMADDQFARLCADLNIRKDVT